MNYLANIDTSGYDRMKTRYSRFMQSRPKAASFGRNDEIDEERSNICVEGIAVLFNELIVTKTGDLIVFENSCFDSHLASGKRTEMWFAHDPSHVIGSTDTGMEFVTTDKFLAFRLPLTNERYAASVKEKIESGKQSAISVGITRTKERTEKIAGRDVIFIEQAELRENSLVAEGACIQSYARLIDSELTPPLRDSVHSNAFMLDATQHHANVLERKQLEWNADKPHMSWREKFMTDGRGATARYEKFAQEKPTHLFY
jgi:HK97 family phage prohead protease